MSVVDFDVINPYVVREDNMLVNANGDITLCYHYKGPFLNSLRKSEIEKMTADFASSLSFLGDHCVVHKQDVYRFDHLSCTTSSPSFLSQAYMKMYDKREYLLQESYIYLTKTWVLSANRDYSIGRTRAVKKQEAMTPDERRDIEKLEQEAAGWITYLSNMGMKLIPLSEDETDRLVNGYFSLFDPTFIGDIDFVDQQIGLKKFNIISFSSGEQFPDYIEAARLNDNYKRFATTVANSTGEEREVGLYSDFLEGLGYGLKTNHILNTIFFADGKQVGNARIEELRKNFGSWRFFSTENSHIADALLDFENDTLQANETIVRCHCNILFFGEKKLDIITQEIRSRLKEYGITGRVANKYDVRHLFLASCPGNAGTLPYEETFIGHASATAALAVKQNVSVPSLSGKGLLMADRESGALVRRDCWDKPYQTKQITNRNWLGVGKSGSGKSSMTIEWVRQYLEYDFNITIMDIGRSFEVLAKSHGGNYIIYKDGVELGVNPYSFTTNKMSVEEIEFLTSFTSVLWKPNTQMTDEQNDALEKIILSYYKGVRMPRAYDGSDDTGFLIHGNFENASIESFYRYVVDNRKEVEELSRNNKDFFDYDSFAMGVEKFVDGKYDRMLKGKNVVDPKNQLTVWELDNIKDHPILFPIVSMLITYLTTNIVWKQVAVDKIVLIEEAWKMLEKPSMASYIKWLYKTIRKFDGGVGVNIQQANDLIVAGSETIKETVLSNSDVMFIMAHTPSMAINFAKIMKWDDYKLGLLLSIPLDENKAQGNRRFTELLSVVGTDIKPMRLEVSKEQVVTFMSEMKDKEKLFPLVDKQKGNWELGIKEYVNLYMK